MAYDSYLPNNWWGSNSPLPNMAGWGADGKVIPFDQRVPRQAGATGAPTAPGATPAPSTTAAPALPDYSQIQNIIQQINATNQQAQTNANNTRIPMAPQLQQQSSQNIADLLNPPQQYAEIDVPSASRAVASGTVGSPFAGINGINMTRLQRQADMRLGEDMLSGALARNPGAPVANPQALLQQIMQQTYGAGQNQMDRDLRERIANAEMANAALRNRNNTNAYNNRSNSYGPSLPTQYGRPDGTGGVGSGSSTNIPEDPNRFGPAVLPPLQPNIGGLDNWAQLGTFNQDSYNAALSQNPYYGMPDYMNPYSGDPVPLGDPNSPGDFPFDPSMIY